MRKKLFRALTGLSPVLFLVLVLTACPNPSGGVNADYEGTPVSVSAFFLNGTVTAPVRDAQPVTTAINTPQYTGTVAWQTEDGTAHSGPFAASTVYKAVVTLTAKTGYTFTGVAANSFTFTGATVTNAANSGIVTITFPATGSSESPGTETVNALSLDGEVTAPVRDTQPVTTGIDETQYTGTVAWQTAGGTAHSGAFAPATIYKAVVTLTAKTGYTFTGVAANSFTFTGATAVTNAANSGVVTITFPATAASGADTIVNAFSLDGNVTAPVRDAQPVTAAIDATQYTGTVAWQTEGGTAHSGPFAASTVYKAVVTLTAKTGYTFTGVAANSFTFTGATSIANAANSGIVTITFPATGSSESPGTDTAVTAFSLDGKVTAPVRDAQPVTAAIDTTQYTGTVAWQTEGGTAHSGPFAASTVYKAVVTLTAKTGYTFNGVTANSFTFTGATSVTNAANSGIVTITFPATGEADPNATIPIGNPSVKLYLNGGSTPLEHNGSTTIEETGFFTVSIDSGYTSIVWYLNGTQVTANSGEEFILLSKRTEGNHNYLVTVEATPTTTGGVKQSGAHTFVVE